MKIASFLAACFLVSVLNFGAQAADAPATAPSGSSMGFIPRLSC